MNDIFQDMVYVLADLVDIAATNIKGVLLDFFGADDEV
jgi:hypothetical protein